ncbi:hypothetical protein [Sphingosinicella sp. CPCC 101087]|uniref:hypothetical protein n=1 Tax=Sphingosinicella sp. CPCC 101087 TaxID=2497754 RepID=UPI00101DC480|nr:hypothetical protein [Sphingosinicella sp. CPCC 101087]
MRNPSFLLPLLLMAGCAAADAEPQSSDNALSRMLAGRTAGTPENCVRIEPSQSLNAIGTGTIVYGSGRTIWHVRLRGSCPSIRRLDTLLVEPTGSQYCRGDHVRSIDPPSRIPGPVCVIESFVPHTRPGGP